MNENHFCGLSRPFVNQCKYRYNAGSLKSVEVPLMILVGLALTTFICSGSGYCVGVTCTSVLLHIVFCWVLEWLQLYGVVESLERECNQPWLLADKR